MSVDRFRLSCPFDLEALCLKEFEEKSSLLSLAFEQLEINDGSISFSMSLKDMRILQEYLKIPTNISMLIREPIRCRDLPKLYKILEKIPWNQYLLNASYRLKIRSNSSRLGNEKRIAETATEAIASFHKKQSPKKREQSYEQEIILAFKEDTLEVALNFSGEALYKRGKRLHGKAPLRENYGAALYYFWKINTESQLEKASIKLYDPMCGSGSILREANDFYKRSNRDFASNYLPQFLFEKRNATEAISKDESFRLYASDLSEQATKNLKDNFKEFGLSLETAIVGSATSEKGFPITEKMDVILSNLPYDERIRFQNSDYKALLKNWKDSNTQEACFIIPRKKKTLFLDSLNSTETRLLDFKNSGLAVSFLFLKKSFDPGGA